MAQITSNTFTINVNRETTGTTKTITSNTFTININRQTTSATKTITSNTFTVNINRQTNTEEDLTTKVIIYKGTNELTAVNHTPSTGEYQVIITGTKNCTAKLKSDNKTIRLLSVSSSAGQINIAINVENVKTYNKTISVASIISNEVVHETIVKQSQLEQTLDGFKSTVSATYQTKDDMKDYSTTSAMNSAINQKANEITSTVSQTYATQTTTNNMQSQIQQNADSISTKVDVNGVISSINQSSETIAINASKINLNGYVSNDDANWSIDNEGNMRAENLKIEGEAGADTLSVNYIDNPRYPATLAGSVHLYVNANTGNDDYTIDDILQSYDEAEEQGNGSLKKKFKTLQGALDASPAFLNNKNLRITLETDTTEDIYIRGFTSGAVRIYLNGKTIYGNVHGYANSPVYIYGGTVDNTTATQGVIHPNTGFNIASRCVSVGFESCQYVGLYKVKIFGADNKPSSISSDYKVAVASSAGTGSIYCSDVQITNCAIGFRSNNMGCMHVAKSSGKASRYGFESTTGGQISIADDDQAGGTTANTSESSGGQVWYKSPTFDGNTTSSETTTAPVVSTTKTMTIKSSYGDTYRSSVYNNWKKDGTARQGDYGYGECTGCWFFGTAFSELKGKTINKVQITINRQRGGSYAAVGLAVRTHNYSARPSGAPTLSSSSYGTLSIPTGTSGTLTITDSDVLNGIKNGTVKGFGIRTTYDSAHYAVCSGSVTVKITYTE